MRWLLTCLGIALVSCSTGMVEPAGSSRLLLRNVTVIDGTGATPHRGVDLLIERDEIAAIRPAGEISASPSDRVLDLTGRYVLPGLIDTHAHVTVLRREETAGGQRRMTFDSALSEQALRLLLEHGVTTVRNPGAPTAEGVALRDAVAAGTIAGPRIITSGDILMSGRLSAEEARAEVRRQAAAGVDLIKIYAAIRPEVARAVIDEAHSLGVSVTGHLQRTTWSDAAVMGIDSITHGIPWAREYLPAERRESYSETMLGRLDWLEWVDPEGPEISGMIELLVRHGVPLDPTLIAYHTKHWGNDPRYTASDDLRLVPELAEQWRSGTFVDDWSSSDFERAQRLWPKVEALVRRYHQAGILLAAGSDVPNPWVIPGLGLHQELRLLVDAGIPPLDVLTIATRNGARLLGIEAEVGTIEAGKVADLLVIGADPLQNIDNTRAIEMVIQRGQVVWELPERPAD